MVGQSFYPDLTVAAQQALQRNAQALENMKKDREREATGVTDLLNTKDGANKVANTRKQNAPQQKKPAADIESE